MSETVISVENLSVKFGDHIALQNLDFRIPGESFVAIVGPNGAGKSTLLKVLLGLVPPTSGNVHVLGKSIKNVDPEQVGYVPQVKTMDRSFPAQSLELVMTGLSRRWPWKSTGAFRKKAMDALRLLGSVHLAERPIARLSGGELQRVCLARSIVRQPKVVMLDEPATGIDAVGEADMYDLLEKYQKTSGGTILMITHDWHAANHHANLILLLNQRQVSFGPPSQALKEDNLMEAFGHMGHQHRFKLQESK
ncbi:MAG: metal ABC transporter ATP-binding protein [Calditrichia bacterium]